MHEKRNEQAERKGYKMCVAIPGKVLSISGERAQVDFQGNTVPVNIGVVDPKVGDYVLVHAGFAIEIVDEQFAQETLDIIREFPELAGADL